MIEEKAIIRKYIVSIERLTHEKMLKQIMDENTK